jgi:hypothetical protein
MPASRIMPPERRASWVRSVRSMDVAGAVTVFVLMVVGAYHAGKRVGAMQELMAASPSNALKIALVKKQPCATGWCETLWIGNSRSDVVKVAELTPGSEHCDEIAWAADGYRVGFVINGYQFRIFDGMTRTAINQVNLIDPDGTPTSRIVRGVTFSQNGAAVTFDDCPRGRSGCRSGLTAVR